MPQPVVENQTFLDIILDTRQDISTGTVFRILYEKPDNTSGQWTAVLEGTTKVKYAVANASDLDQTGTWKLQSYVEIGGDVAYGQPTNMVVLPKLN